MTEFVLVARLLIIWWNQLRQQPVDAIDRLLLGVHVDLQHFVIIKRSFVCGVVSGHCQMLTETNLPRQYLALLSAVKIAGWSSLFRAQSPFGILGSVVHELKTKRAAYLKTARNYFN